MSTSPKTISELFAVWPSIAAFSEEIECGYEAARKMRDRGRIAVQYWPKLVSSCSKRGLAGVTYEWLVEQHSVEAAA